MFQVGGPAGSTCTLLTYKRFTRSPPLLLERNIEYTYLVHVLLVVMILTVSFGGGQQRNKRGLLITVMTSRE